MQQLSIQAIPALRDNYIWMIHNQTHAALVDPGEAAPALAALEEKQLKLSAILCTHHHPDHIGGVADLLQHAPVPVYASADSRMPERSIALSENDQLTIPELNLTLNVIEVPGHTRSHIAFYSQNGDHKLLFSGDTLFSVGCGKLFEGSPEQMQRSFNKLAQLHGDTKVYCGHEYTVSNCEFALQVEPENQALQARFEQAKALRSEGKVTLPSTLSDERNCNPFMRTTEDSVIKAALENGAENSLPATVFGALRNWKDRL